MRRPAIIGAVLACALGAGGVVTLSASGEDARRRPRRPPAPPPTPSARQTELPPLPTDHEAKVVEPVAGASGAPAAPARRRGAGPAARRPRSPKGRASTSRGVDLDAPRDARRRHPRGHRARNGIALPPLEAPEAVRQMIEAGNVIARTPYLWGGGHGKWVDTGYDCSGSVSFVLASAGYLDSPLASGPLMSWGEPGPGKWVTIYAHQGHVWMVVAGIRFDTSGARETGSRWQNEMRSTAGFVARHPPGL